MMIVQVINQSLNMLPAYETPQSAGMDVRSYINETIFDGQNKLQLNKCYATRKRT